MPPETQQKKEPRLTNGTIGLMVGFALGFDILEALIGLIPVVGWGVNIAIDLFVLIILYIWFMLHRVNFTKNRAYVFAGLALLKFIPVIEEFPFWILDVIAVSIMVRLEDKFNLTSSAQKIKAGKRVAVLMAKNKTIGGIMDSTEKGKQLRQQIIQSQRQSLAKKDSSTEPKNENVLPQESPKTEEKIATKTPSTSPKKENPQPLPEIGKNSRQPTPEA